ncbi:MAG: CocE/NonD family hydrolase [Gammaproteobacteria bacterium]|nr:CocE/NonD family hydrolase [Gammaproteobacteria bacterium]
MTDHVACPVATATAWALVLAACSAALLSCTSVQPPPFAAAATPEEPPARVSSASPAERPRGWSDCSYYLAMRDGVRLAVSLYFPAGRAPATRAPTILIQTRYGRAKESLRGGEPRDVEFFLGRGYVVAIIDTRGSTSSFGPRDVEMGPDERADMDEIIAHLAAQPWSDGHVIAYGVSYMADTAVFAASRPAPALVAAIPRELDFDAYAHGFLPGGVLNEFLLYVWGRYTARIDSGRSPGDEGRDCPARVEDCAALFPLLQPIDEDASYTLLRAAVGQRRRWTPEDYLDAPFRDDAGRNGCSMLAFSPAAELAALRRERKPMMVWGSWLDATTAEAALALFRSARGVPMEIWITGNNHANEINADPFFPERRTPAPERFAQFGMMLDFARRVLASERIRRNVHYYVLGLGEFLETPVWPPAGVASKRYFLTASRALDGRIAAGEDVLRYVVDFSAGTGRNTRWSTQFGPPPAYPDRRSADAKLIIFDTAVFDADMELVGTPVIDLYVAAQSADPAFFVYLEDVGADGRVTYITEGQLRAIHRAPADPRRLPYDQGPAPHSFARSDALAVVPGVVMNIRFALNPTAALVRRGHRLRVAIAGADADVFRRHSDGGQDAFDLHVGGARASAVEIPLRPLKH